MDSLLNIDTSLLKQSYKKLDKETLSEDQKNLFLSIMENKNSSNVDIIKDIFSDSIKGSELSLAKALINTSKYSANLDIFDQTLLNAINGDESALKTLSAASNLNVLRELTNFSSKKDKSYFDSSSTDTLWDFYNNHNKKDMIKELEEKLKTIKENISKTKDEEIKDAYEEEYKIYSKVLDKYKEFQKENEDILAQMIKNHKQNPLL